MKTLLRDRKKVYYALPTGKQKQTDAYGNYTGETVNTYADPVCYDRLSAPKPGGLVETQAFGLSDAYLTAFVTHDMSCPIGTETRLWVDRRPYDTQGNLTPHTHVVKRVWTTLHAIRIEAEEVSVS